MASYEHLLPEALPNAVQAAWRPARLAISGIRAAPRPLSYSPALSRPVGGPSLDMVCTLDSVTPAPSIIFMATLREYALLQIMESQVGRLSLDRLYILSSVFVDVGLSECPHLDCDPLSSLDLCLVVLKFSGGVIAMPGFLQQFFPEVLQHVDDSHTGKAQCLLCSSSETLCSLPTGVWHNGELQSHL